MKYLFLDVDGVLNNEYTKERFQHYIGLDPKLLSRYLNWRNQKTDLEVVLSSTWRLQDGFRNHLQENGVTWVDVTPNLGRRGEEIFEWLKDKDCSHFAILDDLSEMRPLGRYLVQTSMINGLQDKHLKKADQLLGYT